MDFVAVVDQVMALLRQRGRVAYRTLKVQFQLDDDALEALKDELLYAQQVARDEASASWCGQATLGVRSQAPLPLRSHPCRPHSPTPHPIWPRRS